MTWLTGHLMAVTERPLGPPLKPCPDAAQNMLRHGKTRQTCEIYWRTRQTRSIYGSRGRPMARDGDRHSRYNKSGRAEHNRQSSFELRRDIAQYRGAAHPLCSTDEVMDHKIPEGFKPVNIESYDGTTDPAV